MEDFEFKRAKLALKLNNYNLLARANFLFYMEF